MIAVEDSVLVLLAAGRGSRFGGGGKLVAPLMGRPLGLHIASALEAMPFRARIAVTGRGAPDYASSGFTVMPNDDPDQGMARSIRLGVLRAQEMEAAAVLIALADMPRVTGAHVQRLFDAAEGDDAVVASSDGDARKPPTLFGRARFDALLALDGDAGARELIRAGRRVVAAPAELVDIDTPGELERLRASLG